MKKAFVLTGFISLLFACNNHSETNAATTKTSHHTDSHQPRDNTKNDSNPNDVKGTMDKMMEDMHSIKTTGNNNIDFAAMMVEHHKGAVEMSKIEMEKGTNAELKAFAKKVIDDQTKEIVFMQDQISKAPRAASSNSAIFQKALQGSMMEMMHAAPALYNNNDKDFAAQMIPHHKSAVAMSKAYLQHGDEKSLRTLSENIISSQTKEIKWLTEWLAANK